MVWRKWSDKVAQVVAGFGAGAKKGAIPVPLESVRAHFAVTLEQADTCAKA